MKLLFLIIVLVIAYFYFSPKKQENFTMLYQNPIPDAFGIQHCVPKFDETIGEYKFEKYCENPKNNPQSIPKNLKIDQLSTVILKGPIDIKNGQVFNLDMIKYGALPGGNYMYANRDSTNFGDMDSMSASVKQCLNSPPQGALGFSYLDGYCYFKNKFNLQPKQNVNTFILNRTVQYSISFWMKIADRIDPNAWNNIFSIRNYTDTFRIPAIFVEPNTSTIQFATATTLNNMFLKQTQGTYGQESTSIDSSLIPAQDWNHILFTIQGNQITGYVNGKNALSTTLEGFPLDLNSYQKENDPIQLYIGANNIYPQSGGILIQDVTWYPVALPQDYITAYLWPNINKPSDQNVATAVQFTSANNVPLSISRVNVFDITGKNISQGQMAWSSPGVQGSVPITNITMEENIGWWTGVNNPSVSVSLGGSPFTIGKVELIVEILKSWSNNNPQVYNQTAQNIINQFKNNQIRLHNSGKPGQAINGIAPPATWTNWTTIENSMIQPIQDTGKSLIVKAIVDYSGGFADNVNVGKTNAPSVFAVGTGYNYTKNQAQSICAQYNATVATTAQLKQAQQMGADWCFTGWVSDSDSALYPITTSTMSGCGNGNTGVISFTPSNGQAGVNCFGIKPDQTQYPTGTIKPFSQSTWDQPQPNSVPLWGACQTSFECQEEDAYCRVGDKRCLRDSDCANANQQDKTNRNCARMPRGVEPDPTYGTYVWSESDEAYLKQNGYSDASQKARCESYGYIFTRGNNGSYPGCGGGWCCKRTN